MRRIGHELSLRTQRGQYEKLIRMIAFYYHVAPTNSVSLLRRLRVK
jgi:hypothetical protein